MNDDESESTWMPLAVAEYVDRDEQLLSQLEGLLVLCGGRDELVTPEQIASQTDVSVTASTDVFRQLSQTDAITRESFRTSVEDSSYRVNVEACRGVFERARHASRSVNAYEARQPPATEATPLVTFPSDPAFEDVSPTSFGMAWLMPTLTRQVKRSESSITLVAPFFEKDGFAHLEEVLLAAMDRNVEVRIISRYLTDTESYNYSVLKSFVKRANERDIDLSLLTCVDYTRWNAETPSSQRKQDGATPEFTLHAKIMLFDEMAAYVGSANVTDYGFEHYLETGILLEGPPVEGFVDLVRFLRNSEAATTVSLLE
jgi:putative cardiolipin synthase